MPIPRSLNKTRITTNIQIFDFVLTKDEVEELDALNENKRFITFDSAKKFKEYPFHIEF